MNRNFGYFVALLMVAALLGWGVTGCELIASVDRSRIDQGTGGDQTGGGGTGGTGGGMTGGGGIGGGGGPACDPATCDGVDTDCRFRACDANDECTFENAMTGDPCDDGTSADAAVCDGLGACVECNGNADCTFDVNATECSNNECVPATCNDGIENGDETDVDCGGSCNQCIDGDTCALDADCVSLFCDNLVCTACGGDGDCADLAGHYCSGGDCVPKLVNGDTCTGANQCVSDFCVSEPSQAGVCCNTLCDAIDCQSCRAADTGGNNGACLPITGGADPYNECTQAVNAQHCEGNACSGTSAACAAAPNGHVCRNEVTSPACDLAETCNGTALTCPANSFKLAGAACGDSTNNPPCNLADTCAGGANVCNANLAGSGTNCGSGPTECSGQDTCNGSGVCLPNHLGNGAACGSAADTDCTAPDTCNGSGTCLTNHATINTPCGDGIGEPVCNPDVCDGAGVCTDVPFVDDCLVSCPQVLNGGCDSGVCTDPGVCMN